MKRISWSSLMTMMTISGNRQRRSLKLLPDKLFYSDTNEDLDFAVVAVEDAPGKNDVRGFIDIQKFGSLGSKVNIIHHPNYGMKQVTMRNNLVEYSNDKVIQYLADTQKGSSGAPVFNDHWEIVGLHRQCCQYSKGPNSNDIYNQIYQTSDTN